MANPLGPTATSPDHMGRWLFGFVWQCIMAESMSPCAAPQFPACSSSAYVQDAPQNFNKGEFKLVRAGRAHDRLKQ